MEDKLPAITWCNRELLIELGFRLFLLLGIVMFVALFAACLVRFELHLWATERETRQTSSL